MCKSFMLSVLIFLMTYSLVQGSENITEYTIPEGAIIKNGPRVTVGDVTGLQSKEYWLNGSLVGREAYYESDQIAESLSFREGKRHGPHRMWYEDGTPMYELFYKDGSPAIHARFWHQNGQLKTETLFQNGSRHGLHKQWNSNGKLLGSSNFSMGTGLGREFYDNGQLKMEMLFRNDEFHGIWREWDENGNPIAGTPRYWLDGSKVDEEEFTAQIAEDELLSEYYGRER